MACDKIESHRKGIKSVIHIEEGSREVVLHMIRRIEFER